jgi:hypothetical protein
MKNRAYKFLCLITLLTLISNKLVCNPNDLNYLIISRPIFLEELEPLKLDKEQKGLIVTIVTVEDIIASQDGRDIQEKIRNYILNKYQNDQVDYLLLVGTPDADDNPKEDTILVPVTLDKEWELPIRYVYCPAVVNPDTLTYVPCEMYYSNLHGNWDDDMDGRYGESWKDNLDGIDEVDWLPEIAIGRIPCRTEADLTIYINKLIATDYSNLTNSDIRALSLQAKINNHGVIADSIANELVMSTLPEDPDPTKDAVEYELNNNNYHFVSFTGHSNEVCLSLPDGCWTASGLSSSSSVFFSYIAGCSTSNIDRGNTSEKTFTENLLFKEDCGSIGYIGAWRISTPIGQNDLWRSFCKSFYDGSETIIGKTFQKALRDYYYSYSYWHNGWYKYWHYTMLIYSFFGDPSFQLGNISPNGPEIHSVPNPIARNLREYQYDMDNYAEAEGVGEVSWEIISAPEYFSLNEDGLIYWIPDMYGGEEGNNGRPEIEIQATDNNGSTNQNWVVQCGPTWRIESIPATNAFVDCPYQYDSDNIPDIINMSTSTFKLLEGPIDFRIDSLIGEISWTPTDTGTFEIILKVIDEFNIIFQRFYIDVLCTPQQPSTISGNSYTCLDSTETYSVTNVSGVTYSWNASGGTVSGSGNSINVTWNSTGDQTLTVTPSNDCGDGTTRQLIVTVNSAPSQPSEISGETNPVLNNTYDYEVSPVEITDSYNWNSTGGSITSNGNNSISVTWTDLGDQTLSVVAQNNCGVSVESILNINVVNTSTGLTSKNFTDVHIYPNPANNVLYITNLDSETTIAIYSVSGQKLKEIKTHLRDIEIIINDLKDGLYIIKLTNNNVSYPLKMIKE